MDDMKPKAKLQFVIPKAKVLGATISIPRKKPKWEPKEQIEEPTPNLPSRKTKWGIDLTEDPMVKRGRALALQTRAEQIAAQLDSGKLEVDLIDTTRSSSPPPIYDANGQRTNTREGRKKEQLELERREAIGECMKLNPLYKPPTGYRPVCKEAKLFIPVQDYPGYNFIGLILGPRGNTQKRMEMETGTRIAIRGKGAVKEGKHIQGLQKNMEGAFDDLHVHITSDSYDKIDAAITLIKPLLTPVDEEKNAHKRKQLRELAEMNGTVRETTRCSNCGELGHKDWCCPKDKLSLPPRVKVTCAICGDGSHPTADCTSSNTNTSTNTNTGTYKEKVLDTEYLTFLKELGDGISIGVGAGSSGNVYPTTYSSELVAEASPTTTPTISNDAKVESAVPNTIAEPQWLLDPTTVEGTDTSCSQSAPPSIQNPSNPMYPPPSLVFKSQLLSTLYDQYSMLDESNDVVKPQEKDDASIWTSHKEEDNESMKQEANVPFATNTNASTPTQSMFNSIPSSYISSLMLDKLPNPSALFGCPNWNTNFQNTLKDFQLNAPWGNPSLQPNAWPHWGMPPISPKIFTANATLNRTGPPMFPGLWLPIPPTSDPTSNSAASISSPSYQNLGPTPTHIMDGSNKTLVGQVPPPTPQSLETKLQTPIDQNGFNNPFLHAWGRVPFPPSNLITPSPILTPMLPYPPNFSHLGSSSNSGLASQLCLHSNSQSDTFSGGEPIEILKV